jgi:hypothetical protein
MLGRVDHGFVDINATTMNAAISGSILTEPKVCVAIERHSELDPQSGVHPLVPNRMP